MDVYSQSDVEEFKKLASDFCKKSLFSFIDEKHPDGNFEILYTLYTEACSIGIIALPTIESSGYEYGVWGKQTLDSTTALYTSLIILETLAQTCATFAFFVHLQGIATNALIRTQIHADAAPTMLSLYATPFPPTYRALHDASIYSTQCTYTESEKKNLLNGTIPVAYGYMPNSILVCLPYKSKWSIAYFTELSSMTIQPIHTHGLRGLVHTITFNNSLINHIAYIDASSLMMLLAYTWLGIVAIALGIAKNAYTKAYQYAHERYQRGNLIKNIESIGMLLGESHAKITTIEHALYSLQWGDSYRLLHYAAQLKLMASTILTRAVSDCLQVFGGYGYMEDFGIEKKFRDIHTLAAIAGSPFFMKQYIAQMEMEE